MDPSHVSVLGKVEGEKANVNPETTPAGKKNKRSVSPKPSPRSSKKKPSTSSRPSSEDLKNLDDKWAERFARLEAMLLSKSFAVPVEPVVKPAEVITSQKPFFDPGASTSKLADSTEPSGPSLVQATGDAVPPRGDEMQQNATQPVDAPGAGPDVLPSGTGDAAFSLDQTLTGPRTVLLPVHVFSQPVKCQSSFRWTIGCVRRWKSLPSPSQGATLQETLKLLASSKISSSSLPGRPDGMGCMLRRKTVTMLLCLPGLWNRPNSTVLLAGLPAGLPDRTSYCPTRQGIQPGHAEALGESSQRTNCHVQPGCWTFTLFDQSSRCHVFSAEVFTSG